MKVNVQWFCEKSEILAEMVEVFPEKEVFGLVFADFIVCTCELPICENIRHKFKESYQRKN